MAKKISDLYVNIGAKTDDFSKGVSKVKGEGSELNKTFSKVGGMIAGAFAAERIIAFAGECSQLAQVAEGVEMAFKRIGNETMLEGLRKATKGTVSDLDLMKAAVQANNFGIPLKQLGSLLEFAHQRAKDTGQSVDYLVQSIVMGIGRKCLIGDTLIKTPKGLRRLDSFKENEIVLTKSLTGKIIEGRIKAVHYNGLRQTWKIKLINGYELTGTDNHRIYTSLGYKMISELNSDSEILTDVGLIKLDTIEYAGLNHVWDITLPETENFFANGVISHNSPLILDNLGISAVQLKAKMKGVAEGTESVADVAKAVGEIASEAMGKIGDSVETTKEKLERQKAAWTNLKVEVGGAINTLIGLLFKWGETWDKVMSSERLSRFQKYMFALTGGFAGGAGKKAALFEKESLQDLQLAEKSAKLFEQDLLKGTINQKDFVATSRALRPIYNDLNDKWIAAVQQIEKGGKATRNQLYLVQKYKAQLDILDKYLVDNEGAFAKVFDPDAGGEIKKSLGIIESLKKSIEDVKKKIESETNPKVLLKLTQQAKDLEDRLAGINSFLSGDTKETKGLLTPKTAKVTGATVPGIDMDKAWSQVGESTSKYRTFVDEVETINMDFSSSMQGFAESLANNFGAALNGTMTVGDAFLSAMADFMSQLGQQMIAVGVAGIAMKTLALNPAAALAAGIALVALAGAVQATMSSGVGGSGGSTSTNRGAYSGTGQNELTVYIEGVTKGSDIYWSQKNYNNKLDSTITR